ncbi:phospholipase D family protein (plasmid) [Brevibacillus halotolerans]|nr:phospholipase D family protein [Brevibacillus halotolerans]
MNYYWHGNTLMEEIKGNTNIKKLKISSAYFSKFGLQLLKEITNKNNLSKDEVEIFLSPLFSYQDPGKLLDEACQIATVYIVETIPFHAKVYWMKNKSNKESVIFGSSNFTNGGFEKNIEFDLIKDIETTDEAEKFKMFFDFCRNNGTLVNQNTIATYQKNEKDLAELFKIQTRMKKKMMAHAYKDDPFDEDDYNLEDFYFKYEDYELFFPRNQRRKDSNIQNQREQLREKLMGIHNNIYSNTVHPWGLYCHKRPDNICSSTLPFYYNHYKVTWLGIRYGKSPEEVDCLNKGAGTKKDEFGFQKHACLQFSISQSRFEVTLFHAVANGAFDRSHVHGQLIKDVTYKNKLNNAIKAIQGEGFVWEIIDFKEDKSFTFIFDERDSNDFTSYYLEHDREGRESYLSYAFKPDREEIQTIQTITKNIQYKMKKLLPLYELMAFRPLNPKLLKHK